MIMNILLLALSLVQAAPAPETAISGVVAETMDSGGYTYVRLAQGKDSLWLAVPQMAVAVGKKMSFRSGLEMKDFKSKTLDRTFPVIVFSEGVIAAPPKGKGHGGMKAAHSSRMAEPESGLKVAKASGPDGVTVAELYAKRKELDGKEVSVRAKIVRASALIMGRHWLHLQDGTGDPKAGTHDLTVTSLALPRTGEVVTVKGKVRTDQDFGAGYTYKALIEAVDISK
ncbi:MAG: DNA-binding protein [Elusimicrobia bacterium]|nr:DNA-binding protein [Elusimicrobiota bacterium]